MTIFYILTLVWFHFLADFVLQSHKMAINKSSSNYWLSFHVGTYTIPFLIVFGPAYAVVNGVLHFITDYITSRQTSRLYGEGKMHEFFVVVGFDQAIHLTCLAITFVIMQPTFFGWLAFS